MHRFNFDNATVRLTAGMSQCQAAQEKTLAHEKLPVQKMADKTSTRLTVPAALFLANVSRFLRTALWLN